MSKSFASGRHASSSSGWRATRSVRLCTRIHCLRTPRRRSSLRELEAARRVMPEQIVGDEDVIADRREVAADAVDRSLAHRARVQLPDRAERAAERTASRRLHEIRGTMGEARVLLAPCVDVMPRRQRNVVELQRPGLARGLHHLAVRAAQRKAGNRAERYAALESVAHVAAALFRRRPARRRSSPRRGTALDTRPRCGRRRQSARPGASRADAADEVDDLVGFERVHRGDADEGRTRRADLRGDRRREPQVRERHAMTARLERRRDVFHAERLDAEERSEAEPLVRGDRAQKQDVHR